MQSSEMGPEHPPQVWVKFFEHIAEYDRLYRALLGRQRKSLVCDEDARLIGLTWSKSMGAFPTGKASADHPASPFADEFVPDLVARYVC